MSYDSRPATRAASIGRADRATRFRFSHSGRAKTTVAGPSKKCTNCAPAK